MKVEKCKGMRDLFPADMEKFRLINDVFRESCQKWGYEEVRTPTLEYLHLFTSAGTLTPSMLSKVYSFLDWDGWSGERVVLRPDATIPVARLYTESMSEKELAKLFYIVNTFIFEETGKKNREKWQFGAELIGMGSPMADVELIALALEVLEKLGLGKVELRLSHAGLTRGILSKAGLNSEQQNQVLDKLLDGDDTALAQIKIEKPEIAPLLALQGKSSGFVKNLVSSLGMDLSELKPQIDDFVFIADTLQSLDRKYEIDIASVRGFEYYTGFIFQLFVNGEKVGGGGRYDALIPAMGGKVTPASGFALYLDLLMQLIQHRELTQPTLPKVLIKMEHDAHKIGFDMAQILRKTGYITKFHLGGEGPCDVSWQLEISRGSPCFILTEITQKKKYELKTSEEVLKILKR
jgi:histidyl-tRNA synthetase